MSIVDEYSLDTVLATVTVQERLVSLSSASTVRAGDVQLRIAGLVGHFPDFGRRDGVAWTETRGLPHVDQVEGLGERSDEDGAVGRANVQIIHDARDLIEKSGSLARFMGASRGAAYDDGVEQDERVVTRLSLPHAQDLTAGRSRVENISVTFGDTLQFPTADLQLLAPATASAACDKDSHWDDQHHLRQQYNTGRLQRHHSR